MSEAIAKGFTHIVLDLVSGLLTLSSNMALYTLSSKPACVGPEATDLRMLAAAHIFDRFGREAAGHDREPLWPSRKSTTDITCD